jgi:hypothetical protein
VQVTGFGNVMLNFSSLSKARDLNVALSLLPPRTRDTVMIYRGRLASRRTIKVAMRKAEVVDGDFEVGRIPRAGRRAAGQTE